MYLLLKELRFSVSAGRVCLVCCLVSTQTCVLWFPSVDLLPVTSVHCSLFDNGLHVSQVIIAHQYLWLVSVSKFLVLLSNSTVSCDSSLSWISFYCSSSNRDNLRWQILERNNLLPDLPQSWQLGNEVDNKELVRPISCTRVTWTKCTLNILNESTWPSAANANY